jgi:tetratricopeptide (TPR) repeat protein
MAGKRSLLEDPIFQTLIAAVAATIARLEKLLAVGRYQEAVSEIEAHLDDLVGLNYNQIRYLDDDFIFGLLTVNEFLDWQRLWYVAELINAYGEILTRQGKSKEGGDCRLRALSFFIEVAFATDDGIEEVDDRINEIAGDLWMDLPEEILFNLFGLYERRGAYDQALHAVDRLIEVSRGAPELLEERGMLIRRLSQEPEMDSPG